MHISVPVDATCELLNFTPVNPLISKCEIKVCYVGDKPNRNGSVITKAVATEMAKSLPGCPIVGYYNTAQQDFEEHNRMIDVSNGHFDIIDTTRPYGFVDLNAKVWFKKFLDDGVEHEYLMTEGYVWSDIYPEAQRIIEKGNNQSMELHEGTLKGDWAFDDNGMPNFFIINEAIIQKLCILGENVEPCFEGAGIAAQFSLDEDFKKNMFSMIKELQSALNERGVTQMDENKVIVPEEQQPTDPDTEFKKKDEEEEKKNENPSENKDEKGSDNKDNSENEEKNEENKDEDEEDEKKKKNFSLDEIPEYVELQQNYAALEQKYNEAVAALETANNSLNSLQTEIEPLREFKAASEKKDKQAMIDSFYMLSDEDKKDVVANIDNYSLNDIEAKLSIICVRNKVNFNLDDDKEENTSNPTVYSLGDNDDGDSAPAWIKAVRDTQKSRNI